jgi:hypothetical protein
MTLIAGQTGRVAVLPCGEQSRSLLTAFPRRGRRPGGDRRPLGQASWGAVV